MDAEQAKSHTAAMSCWAASLRIVCALLLGVAAAGCRDAMSSEAPNAAATANTTRVTTRAPYLARRHAHATRLRERGPSPASYEDVDPPPGVVRVTYRSGELDLAAWFAAPLGGSRAIPAPGLVYFHGDFAFGPDDFEQLRRFHEAGFAVMAPMLRGENGNPGDFELLWGEIDDARAAVSWLADSGYVDRHRIHAFGHSIGGGVVAMLTLYGELPLRLTGSCGGIYMPETFGRWAASQRNAELVRFDAADPNETELRVLGPNLPWMVHRHIAYVGEGDPWFVRNAGQLEQQAWALGKPFERVIVPGDHMSSLPVALDAFLQLARAE